MPLTLYPHQIEAVQFSISHQYVVIAHEQGLGKTLTAIDAATKANAKWILVVCPAFLKTGWEREIIAHGEADPTRYAIMSYDAMSKLKEAPPWDFVIFDEAHYLKNPKSKRTGIAHSIIEVVRPKHCLMLTGTPIKNNVGELWSLLKICSFRPGEPYFPYRSEFAFNMMFSNPHQEMIRGHKITKFLGVRNHDELSRLCRGKILRKKLADCIELPPLTEQTLRLEDCTTYDRELADALAALEDDKPLLHFSTVKMQSALTKCNATSKYVQSLLDNGVEQVVIYSDHVASAKTIAGLFSVETAVITGATSMEERQKIIDEFQAGNISVLVATIGALGVGVTLTAANYLVFNDLSWVPANNWQAERRIYRIGQTKPCFTYVVACSSIDESIIRLLRSKQKLIGETIDSNGFAT